MQRDVSARLVPSVSEPATLVFSVAVCADYRPAAEELVFTLDGAAIRPPR